MLFKIDEGKLIQQSELLHQELSEVRILQELCMQRIPTPLTSEEWEYLQAQENSISRRIAFVNKAMELIHETQQKVTAVLSEAIDSLGGNQFI